MKTFVGDINRSSEVVAEPLDPAFNGLVYRSDPSINQSDTLMGASFVVPSGRARFGPYILFLALFCALFLLDAVMPLRALWFHNALLTQMGIWPVWPTLLLFPGKYVIPPLGYQTPLTSIPSMVSSWEVFGLLMGVFGLIFVIYLAALRHLPGQISRRFIFRSSLIFGLLFALIPVVISPDVFSYIAYARIGILYHLNPLTTAPLSIHTDIVYRYTGWVDQPSAYGPTWIIITCLFQYIFAFCHLGSSVLLMLGALRLFGLAMHLSSAALIWSLSAALQTREGLISQRRRVLATLAFAWNPLLLLEACTNAHSDTTLLFLLLLTIWLIVRGQEVPDRLPGLLDRLPLKVETRRWLVYLAPALCFALGICVKINLVLLAPGLFIYQWQQMADVPVRQRVRCVLASLGACCGLVIALYAPFWQGGAVLRVFVVNPAADRTINTLPNTLSHLYNGVMAAIGFPPGALIGSPSERLLHTVSIGLFVVIYSFFCWRTWRTPRSLSGVASLVRWMALVWLFYCAVGSPWYWPWYLTTFLGLYALLEALGPTVCASAGTASVSERRTWESRLRRWAQQMQTFALHPGSVRLLTLSMLTMYCLTAWAAQHTFIPGLPGFQWSSFGGAWAWLLPLLFMKRALMTQHSWDAHSESASLAARRKTLPATPS